jgi:hypothetical protein
MEAGRVDADGGARREVVEDPSMVMTVLSPQHLVRAGRGHRSGLTL